MPDDESPAPPAADVVVRAATPVDDAALVTIDDLTWSALSSPAPRPPPAELVPRRFFDRVPPEDVLVAESDGLVVGYVQLHNAIPIASHAHVLQINGLAVRAEATGRGVGAALLGAAVAEAKRRGAAKLSLRVLGHNTTARRLYARSGFVEEGVLRDEFRIDGHSVDDVVMARRLD